MSNKIIDTDQSFINEGIVEASSEEDNDFSENSSDLLHPGLIMEEGDSEFAYDSDNSINRSTTVNQVPVYLQSNVIDAPSLFEPQRIIDVEENANAQIIPGYDYGFSNEVSMNNDDKTQ